MAPTIITTTLVPATAPSGGQVYDLVDLATLKSALGIVTGASDAFLKLLITQVSDAIHTYCNRIFPVQTYQDLVWPERDPFPYQVPGGIMPLQLSNWPLTALPSPAGTSAPVPAVLSAISGGALAAATYYVRTTYVTPTGETAGSLEESLIVPANELLVVAAPGTDALGIATGWNVYVSTKPGAEIKQNASPIAIGGSWTLPTSGLLPTAAGGTAVPNYILAIVNIPYATQPPAPNTNTVTQTQSGIPSVLNEGVDFIADAKKGQLTRLFFDGYPKRWDALPTLIEYAAGFSVIPAGVQLAAIRLIKSDYYGQARDPKIRQENIEGVYSSTYWFANGPGEGNFPPDVCNLLDMHRLPVIA